MVTNRQELHCLSVPVLKFPALLEEIFNLIQKKKLRKNSASIHQFHEPELKYVKCGFFQLALPPRLRIRSIFVQNPDTPHQVDRFLLTSLRRRSKGKFVSSNSAELPLVGTLF
jgi:hypothetical protein